MVLLGIDADFPNTQTIPLLLISSTTSLIIILEVAHALVTNLCPAADRESAGNVKKYHI